MNYSISKVYFSHQTIAHFSSNHILSRICDFVNKAKKVRYLPPPLADDTLIALQSITLQYIPWLYLLTYFHPCFSMRWASLLCSLCHLSPLHHSASVGLHPHTASESLFAIHWITTLLCVVTAPHSHIYLAVEITIFVSCMPWPAPCIVPWSKCE